MQFQRNQLVTVETTEMVPGGSAIGLLPEPASSQASSGRGGRAIFVKGGAPNETAEVRLTRIKKDFAEANFVRAVKPSPDRVVAPFPTPALSGANWAHLSYPAQLAAKQRSVLELLRKFGKLEDPLLAPIVPADNIWRYRNKVELTFGWDAHHEVALGFHAPGKFDEIIPTDDIALFPEIGQKIIAEVVSWARREKLDVYEPRRRAGLLRNLVIRRAENGQDLLINLVTMPDLDLGSPLYALDRALEESDIPFSGIVWTQNASLATIVQVDDSVVIAGDNVIAETFLGQEIQYRFDSFFQTHTLMAEKLAHTLLQRLAILKPSVVVDGYAGVGGFGLFAAKHGAKVISIESHEPSSSDARRNAERLGVLDRMEFVTLEMEKYLKDTSLPVGAVLIIDPPRAGIHPKALKAIAESSIEHMFYVSCNPATLARDLATLSAETCNLKPVYIQPFDLFPQTPHVEVLVELRRISVH